MTDPNATVRYTVIDSPLGQLLTARDDVGLTHLYLPGGKHPTSPDPAWVYDDDAFADLRTQLAEYFEGRRTGFDLPLHATGTPFQQQVWAALREIPPGRTRTYGELAAAIGRPGSSRAVGAANGRNPISIVVPCHRVIGADGTLTGYAGGVDAKRWLLAHETRDGGLFAVG